MQESMRRPALIIVDMQNDFVRRGAPMEVPAARAVIGAIKALLVGFRRAGLPVVFTRYIACDGYRHLAGRLGWLRLLEEPTHACVPGVRRSYGDVPGERQAIDVIDELAPAEGETVVDKVYYSAFFRTDLEARLEAMKVDSLVITGTLTEMCVEDTARQAVHFGYPTIMVRDGVASNDTVTHNATLDAFERNYGWTLDCDKVLSLIAPMPDVAGRAS